VGTDERGAGGPRLLIAGLPRSGTSWTARALGQTEGTTLVSEPDNDRNHVEALKAKARLGRYPILGVGDIARAYASLWRYGMAGVDHLDGRRNRWATAQVAAVPPAEVERVMTDPSEAWPARLRAAVAVARVDGRHPVALGPVLVKSVHCALALDWVVEVVAPDAVLLIVRHPANVIGSWRDMGWGMGTFPWSDPRLWERFAPGGERPPGERPEPWIVRASWQFALMASALVAAADRHGWLLVDHADLLDDPPARLSELAGRLGLDWTEGAQRWVVEGDRPGQGYDLTRVTAQERDRWRGRLADDEVQTLASVLGHFDDLDGRWPLV